MRTDRSRRNRDAAARLLRTLEAKRRLGGEGSGRAWINGREVGGQDPRWAHLARSHD